MLERHDAGVRRAKFVALATVPTKNLIAVRIVGFANRAASLLPPCSTCPWRIPKIMRQWVSDKGRDSVAASEMNQVLLASPLSLDLAVVLPIPSAHVVD